MQTKLKKELFYKVLVLSYQQHKSSYVKDIDILRLYLDRQNKISNHAKSVIFQSMIFETNFMVTKVTFLETNDRHSSK
jgi:hypothetical protein